MIRETRTHDKQRRPNVAAPKTDRDDSEDAATAFFSHWAEWKAYAEHHWAARLDLARHQTGRWAVRIVLGLFAAQLVIVLVITAAVYGVRGYAELLRLLCGGRPWAGDLLTCLTLTTGMGLAVWLLQRKLLAAEKRRIEERYESRRQKERAAFGHDVEDRAAENAGRR